MSIKNFTSFFLICLAFSWQTTHASSLIYGATLNPVPVGSFSGANSIYYSGPQTFSAPDYSGTLYSTVWNNDSSNPNGLNDLTFTYLINIDFSAIDPVNTFSISSFASYLTDVSYTTSSPNDIIPSMVQRQSAPGSIVRFTFGDVTLSAGTTSALLIIRTDAQNYAFTQAGFLDGVGSQANSVAPSPVMTVPEPTTFALAGLGGLSLLLLRRQRK